MLIMNGNLAIFPLIILLMVLMSILLYCGKGKKRKPERYLIFSSRSRIGGTVLQMLLKLVVFHMILILLSKMMLCNMQGLLNQ